MSIGQCLVEGMQKKILSSGKLYKVTLLLCKKYIYTYIHRFTFDENFYLSVTNSKLFFLEVFWEKGNFMFGRKKRREIKRWQSRSRRYLQCTLRRDRRRDKTNSQPSIWKQSIGKERKDMRMRTEPSQCSIMLCSDECWHEIIMDRKEL